MIPIKIELYPNACADLKNKTFDAFEVHPCRIVPEDKEKRIKAVEQCEPEEAEFWSVYIHLVGGGVDCIADCKTEKDADGLVTFLKGICVNYKPITL